MTFFTSVNNFYLAKARVLAKSIKKYIPEAFFVLILSDKYPNEFNLDEEPFDEIITIDRLSIPVDNLNVWIYMHSTVELCTAVKGQALVNLLEKYDKVVYLDPDIAVFNNLNILDNLLNQYDIIFTPHQTVPEENERDIISNEICSLQHGTYNFGFFAVRSNKNGKSYAKWYRDRLINYCTDDKEKGLFTDQRWGDIAPALFDNLYIWKNPGANVSTWNLTHRVITKQKNEYYVNGEPLLFYHFSGFDSGAQLNALDLFSNGNPVLYELRDWYIEEMNKNGQQKCKDIVCFYNVYSDGTIVKAEERKLFKNRVDLQNYFFNPYEKDKNSYFSWFINNNENQVIKNKINNIILNINKCLNNQHNNVLILTHFWNLNLKKYMGGTALHIFDLINKLKSKYNFYILAPYNEKYCLFCYWENGEEIIEISSIHLKKESSDIFNSNYAEVVQKIIECFNINIIHIHHMIGHFFNITDIIKNNKIKLIITLHDYYSVCPLINKVNHNNIYCGYHDESECFSCLTSNIDEKSEIKYYNNIKAWKNIWIFLFSFASKIIVPSETARKEIINTYSHLSIDIIEHGIDIEHTKEELIIDTDKEFHVAFLGNISIIKGSKIIEELVKYTKKNDNIYFHLFGDIKSEVLQNNFKHYIFHGPYNRDDLSKLFKENNIKLVCIFSIWPETYSYTLSECAVNNIPVLAIDIGAVGQRVRENKLGWLIRYNADISEIYKSLINIFNNKDEYKIISKSISDYKIKNIIEMCNEYDNIYSTYNVIEKRNNNKKNITAFINENYLPDTKILSENNRKDINGDTSYTWFTRKFRSFIKCCQETSIKYAIKVYINKVFRKIFPKYKIMYKCSLSRNVQVYDILVKKSLFGKVILKCGGSDPQICFPIRKSLNKPKRKVFVKIEYKNTLSGNLKIYYDYGTGFNENNSSEYIYIEKSYKMNNILSEIENWQNDLILTSIRIDPPDNSEFLIKSIKILLKL